MTQHIQDIWKRFDELAERATDESTKVLVEAIKLHAELVNLRLVPLNQDVAAVVQHALPKWR